MMITAAYPLAAAANELRDRHSAAGGRLQRQFADDYTESIDMPTALHS
jgi:hypothetical protein